MHRPPTEITLLTEQGTHICSACVGKSNCISSLNILVSVCVCLNREKALECVQSLPTDPTCWPYSLTSPTGALYTSASPHCSTSPKSTGEHIHLTRCRTHSSYEPLSDLTGLYILQCGPLISSGFPVGMQSHPSHLARQGPENSAGETQAARIKTVFLISGT